jgi:hypothetical protein
MDYKFLVQQLHHRMEGNFQRDLTGTCPHCHYAAHFEKYLNTPDIAGASQKIDKREVGYFHGMRRCPNCRNNVFLVAEQIVESGRFLPPTVVETFPEPSVEFNRDGLSQMLQDLFEECLVCFQNHCFRAAAILLRRCLEQICAEKGITGGTLHHRLNLLKPLVQIDERLYAILFDIKLLGNDAAHANLASFDKIGHDEASLAIEVFKKVLDSLYHTPDLLTQFQNLKKQPPTP